MKKLSVFIAFAVLVVLTMVSCNNKPKEPTQEEVQEMKQALADSVLAQIDAFAEEFIIADGNRFHLKDFELTEKEKKIKPDYLLDPSEVNKFVTKSQKVNALAVYVIELGIRRLYDMPLEEAKETIAKLALDVNYPLDLKQYESDIPVSEIIRMEYKQCKENGDVSCFWQFAYAVEAELSYLVTQNPEFFDGNISDEQWNTFCQKWHTSIGDAIKTLAKYDEEMATLLEFRNNYYPYSSQAEIAKANSSIETAKQYHIANKDKYIARRNALLNME